MVTEGINAPHSSGAGRLFDAFAAVLGICPNVQTYEGEAAIRLEAMAVDVDEGLPFTRYGAIIDPAPIWAEVQRALSAGVSTAELSGRFHLGLARTFAEVARDLVTRGEARAIVLSGGCFQNARLLRLILQELGNQTVLTHRETPANDGGLALGQAVVAAAGAIGQAGGA
jgi:hydrogenase maturation protein HypF